MTSDVFWVFLTYLPTHPNQMVYYILKPVQLDQMQLDLPTYLPTQKSDVICECALNQVIYEVKNINNNAPSEH